MRKEVYIALAGHIPMHGRVDAVTVVAALGGVSRKTARGWYESLKTKGWCAAFTSGVAPVGPSHEAVGSPQEAVGSTQDALP